ncbi:MAG TPA: porin, partial [Planctomycetaceae bacterium]|nr:porin [Planctomycetaceae bacterium]
MHRAWKASCTWLVVMALSVKTSLAAEALPLFEEAMPVPPAPATTQPPAGDLSARVQTLEAELESLRNRLSSGPIAAPQGDGVTPANAEFLPPTPAIYDGGYSYLAPVTPAAAPVKYPNVTINGFFQADSLWFGQDAENRANVGDIQDGSGFRRMRLSAKGAVAENVNYFAQLDFGFFGRPSFTDVWGEVTKVPVLGNVRVGQWKQPFGLETVTSVRYQPFLERSL